MLIIPQCRFCNADKATCPIKQGLKVKLQKAGIKERLRYECKDWKAHMLFKHNEVVQFRFLMHDTDPENDSGWVLSDKVIAGQVIDRTDRRPIYIVRIDRQQLDIIAATESPYAQQAQAILGLYPDEKPTGFYLIPVREQFVIKLKN